MSAGEDDAPLLRAEDLVRRARDGEDVGEAITRLPEPLRSEAAAIVAGERRVLAGLGTPAGRVAPPRVPGRYSVLGELGRGGMGVVYRAWDAVTQRVVVLKLLGPDAGDERARRRFLREGDALARVGAHPHVVQVLAVHAEAADPCIAMELVEGTPLDRLLRASGRLAPAVAARIVRDAARGLAAVHRRGLLHRDVKPGNIIVQPDGRAKVVDFGLAKDSARSVLTLPGQLLGTALYMAPEQWEDATDLDARGDVWSLGVTLYELLSGAPPFTGDDAPAVRDAVDAGEYRPLREVVPDLPAPLERVVAQALATERSRRYGRMEELADDLERVLRGQDASYPCLVAGEARHPLLGGQTFHIGRDAGCEVRLQDPTVSRQHAVLRREDDAWVLRPAAPHTATWVDGAPLQRARPLAPGERVRVGETDLLLEDPRARLDVDVVVPEPRLALPDVAVRALVTVRDSAVALALVERLAPDPGGDARRARALARPLGQADAARALERRAAREAALRPALAGVLGELAGEPPDLDAQAWLAWWEHARRAAPAQVAAPRVPVRARLRAPAGVVELTPERRLLRIGRDPRCELRLEHPTVSRFHATVQRLHRRLALRDLGGRVGTLRNGAAARHALLDPGDALRLGDVALAVEVDDPGAPLPEVAPGVAAVDAATFEALLDLGHPSVAWALVAALREPDGAPAWAVRGGVERPGEPRRAEAFVQAVARALEGRREEARRALPRLLGLDAGGDAAAWERALARAALPPQVAPAGWLAATADVAEVG